MRVAMALIGLVVVAFGCGPTTPNVVPASARVTASASAPPATVSGSATGHSAQPTAVEPGTSASATPPDGASATPLGWASDLAALVPGMDRLHPELDHGASTDELNQAAADLAASAPTLTDDELLDGVMRIVAMVSREGCDAHTGAYIWGDDSFAVDSLPLRLWLFDDGVYVVDALDPFRSLIGSRVDSIAGIPTADVITAVEPLIPRDNEWTVRNLTARYLLIPQVLSGVGIPTGASVAVSTLDPSGTAAANDIAPIPMGDYNEWAGPYGLHLPADSTVLYLSRMDDPLWWRGLGGGTLFVQYNQTSFVSGLLGDLRDAITAAGVTRVVLDLRHNTGGEVRAVDELVNLFAQPDVSAIDGPYVITGRNTFSAAGLLVARLQADAGATIVGEPMGACPTAWGNARQFELPFSGIDVSVATQLEVGASEDDTRDTIQPDIAVPLTQSDWAAHRDPALEAVQALPAK